MSWKFLGLDWVASRFGGGDGGPYAAQIAAAAAKAAAEKAAEQANDWDGRVNAPVTTAGATTQKPAAQSFTAFLTSPVGIVVALVVLYFLFGGDKKS